MANKKKKETEVSVTLIKGCSYTDGADKYVPGKKYEVSPKEADRLIASGSFKKLG